MKREELKQQLSESFDRPFTNIIKRSNVEYTVNEDGVIGEFYFHRMPNNNNLNNEYIFNDKVDIFYDVSWGFGNNMKIELKTASNWTKMTTTTFKIMDDFIRTMKPKVIKFSYRTPGNWKIYSNSRFIDILETLFGEKFDVWLDKDGERIFLIDKNVSKFNLGPIEKNTENGCMNVDEAWQKFKFPRKKDAKGIIRNDILKEQQKRILYKLKYIF